MTDHPKWDYKEYPKTLPAEDFWGQVRRTIRGRRITEDEVEVMVGAITEGLGLANSDVVLDVACGNGALSRYLFPKCAAFLGVDASEYLIQVARENFERRPLYRFEVNDAVTYLESETDPGRFTKVLCYGSFSYLSENDACQMLHLLNQRFTNVGTVYLGNLPDKERAEEFYGGDAGAAEMAPHESQIGIWRSAEEMRDLARASGWSATILRMPGEFFNAAYRFDARLERALHLR